MVIITRNMKLLAVMTVCSLLLVGCASTDRPTIAPNNEVEVLSCVIILPTKVPYDNSSAAPRRDPVLQEGAHFLQQQLTRELRSARVARVMDPEQLSYGGQDFAADNFSSLQRVARQNDCPYVLVSEINRFKQRQGGEFAVDAPASASFALKLVDTRSQGVLWFSTFAETQQSLLSNLLSFNKAKSRGFKWITVEDLVTRGVREKLHNNPYFY